MTTTAPSQYFLFQRYSISELATLTYYSEAYLLAIKHGNHPANGSFRMRMAKALRISETALFSVAQTPEQGTAQEEETHGVKERTQRSGRG